jgi:hypothetical protein
MTMNYWLDLFTPFTWTRFREHGATISGFRPRQRKTAFGKVKQGDYFLCYLVKLSRWCGVLEITSNAFEDATPIFVDENDPFVIRFQVKPVVMLDFEHSIPINEPSLWSKLSFTRDIVAGSLGWAQSAKLRQSLFPINADDGLLLVERLKDQGRIKRKYDLDSSDLRQIATRTVIRTETGEVSVEVPDREELPVPAVEHPIEARESLKMQAKVAQLGSALGFTIWIPPADRARVLELVPKEHADRVVKILPVTFDPATVKTIENIDVLWLQRRAIVHAFEIEHSTAIYSGLLRMADLLAMQPRLNIDLHIVAPLERREQVRKEVVRPVFAVLEGGSMADKCSFISYDQINELLSHPNLSHMRDSILDDYQEYFEPA